jgi:translation initiation factor 1A
MKSKRVQPNLDEPMIKRAKLPKEKEVIGVIENRLGGNRMEINCFDGKTRNCRVPGRLRRKLWLRPGDIVIVQPWELDDSKADILFKYPSNQVEWLKKNNYLETEKIDF